jgi:hypothetical protein
MGPPRLPPPDATKNEGLAKLDWMPNARFLELGLVGQGTTCVDPMVPRATLGARHVERRHSSWAARKILAGRE